MTLEDKYYIMTLQNRVYAKTGRRQIKTKFFGLLLELLSNNYQKSMQLSVFDKLSMFSLSSSWV